MHHVKSCSCGKAACDRLGWPGIQVRAKQLQVRRKSPGARLSNNHRRCWGVAVCARSTHTPSAPALAWSDPGWNDWSCWSHGEKKNMVQTNAAVVATISREWSIGEHALRRWCHRWRQCQCHKRSKTQTTHTSESARRPFWRDDVSEVGTRWSHVSWSVQEICCAGFFRWIMPVSSHPINWVRTKSSHHSPQGPNDCRAGTKISTTHFGWLLDGTCTPWGTMNWTSHRDVDTYIYIYMRSPFFIAKLLVVAAQSHKLHSSAIGMAQVYQATRQTSSHWNQTTTNSTIWINLTWTNMSARPRNGRTPPTRAWTRNAKHRLSMCKYVQHDGPTYCASKVVTCYNSSCGWVSVRSKKSDVS